MTFTRDPNLSAPIVPPIPPVPSAVVPPVVAPPIAPSVVGTTTVNIPANFQTNPPKKPLLIVGIILGVLALGVGMYFVYNLINLPTRIKEQVEMTQPVFEGYSRAVTDIADDLKSDGASASDSESLTRAQKKTEGLVKNLEDLSSRLSTVIEKLKMPQLSKYKTSMDVYYQKTKDLVLMEKDNLGAITIVADIYRDYEKIELSMSGVSNYMLSDPDKYLQTVGEAITKEEELISRLKNSQSGSGEMTQKIVQILIDRMQAEVELLKGIKSGVENRNVEEITAAEKDFNAKSQNSLKETNLVIEQINEKIKTLTGDIESLRTKVNEEYSQLRSKYSF